MLSGITSMVSVSGTAVAFILTHAARWCLNGGLVLTGPPSRCQRPLNLPLWHGRPRHPHVKPTAHVRIQADAMHEVVDALLQRPPHRIVVHAGRVDKAD